MLYKQNLSTSDKLIYNVTVRDTILHFLFRSHIIKGNEKSQLYSTALKNQSSYTIKAKFSVSRFLFVKDKNKSLEEGQVNFFSSLCKIYFKLSFNKLLGSRLRSLFKSHPNHKPRAPLLFRRIREVKSPRLSLPSDLFKVISSFS